MNQQATHLSNISSEFLSGDFSTPVSIDSLETGKGSGCSVYNESTVDSLNKSEDDANTPSFVNILSSSFVEDGKLSQSEPMHTASSDVKQPDKLQHSDSPNNIKKVINPAAAVKTPTDTHKHVASLFEETSSLSNNNENVCLHDDKPSAAAAHNSGKSKHLEGKTKLNSKIPKRIGNNVELPATQTGSSNSGSVPDGDRIAFDQGQNADIEVILSLDVAVPHPPVCRTQSQHTLQRPVKDFVLLNKNEGFRRRNTYHSLHLEKKAKPTSTVSAPAAISESTDSEAKTQQLAAEPTEPQPATSAGPSLAEVPSPHHTAEALISLEESLPGQADSDKLQQASGAERRLQRRSQIPIPIRGTRSYRSRAICNASNSEWQLSVPRLQLPSSQLSLIDVNDNRPLLSESSAPCLLESPVHECLLKKPQQNLILLEDSTSSQPQVSSPRNHRPAGELVFSPRGCASREARLRGPVTTPPCRPPVPHRHIEFKPNLRPYLRGDYISLGKLGPDPVSIRENQTKMLRKQQYADLVNQKNRSTVKQKAEQYSQQQKESPNPLQKMLTYARNIPKPKTRPAAAEQTAQPDSPRRAASLPRNPPQVSTMSKIQQLLAEGGATISNQTRTTPFDSLTDGYPAGTSQPTSRPPCPVPRTSQQRLPPCSSGTTERRPVRRPPASETTQRSMEADMRAPPPLPPPPACSGRPPPAAVPRRRRSSSLGGRARLSRSMGRLRSLTERLLADEVATAAPSVPAKPSVSHDATTPPPEHHQPAPLRRDDTRTTVAEMSDDDSEYSADSVDGVRPPATSVGMVTLGRRHGSPRTERGRGSFAVRAGAAAAEAAAVRRPVMRCSRGVGPDPPGGDGGSIQQICNEEPFSIEQPALESPSASECSLLTTPAATQRRPSVTRGTQARLNDTFIVASGRQHQHPLLVDIGMPLGGGGGGGGRGMTRGSPRPRLGPLPPASSPRDEARRSRREELQRLRERHHQDKRRVDELLLGPSPRL